MSIIFQTGFDHYTTLSHRWTTTQGDASILSNGRNSTSGLRLRAPNSGNPAVVLRTLGVTQSTLYVAFAYQTTLLPTTQSGGAAANQVICGLWEGANFQTELRMTNTGQIGVFRNGTQIGLSPTALSLNVFYHIEWKSVISNTVGSSILKINEVTDLTLTNVNNRGTSNAWVDQVSLESRTNNGGSSSWDHIFDDVVIRNDAFSGDVQVKAFFPTGVGSTNAWGVVGASSSWQATDDSAPNSDTDYISTANVNDMTLLTFGTLPATSSILAVIPMPFAEKTDAGTATIKNVVRSGGSNYQGASQAPSNSSYSYLAEILQTNPATGITWSITDFNAAEFGIIRST